MALINLATVKTYLGVSGSSDDDFLTLQSEIISEAIEGYCGRKFSAGTYTQTFYVQDVDYTNSLPLYHYPLTNVPVVKEVDDNGTETTVTDFRYHTPSGLISKNWGRFFQSGRKVVVTYQAGYTELPALVKHVFYGLVQERYNKKINGIDLNFGADVQRISIPGTISIDFDYSLNTNERKSSYGQLIGTYSNILDPLRSERAVVGSVVPAYVS